MTGETWLNNGNDKLANLINLPNYHRDQFNQFGNTLTERLNEYNRTVEQPPAYGSEA